MSGSSTRIMRWIRRALLWSLGALLAALAVGAIYQSLQEGEEQMIRTVASSKVMWVGGNRER
jgi:hypothetical protein